MLVNPRQYGSKKKVVWSVDTKRIHVSVHVDMFYQHLMLCESFRVRWIFRSPVIWRSGTDPGCGAGWLFDQCKWLRHSCPTHRQSPAQLSYLAVVAVGTWCCHRVMLKCQRCKSVQPYEVKLQLYSICQWAVVCLYTSLFRYVSIRPG